MHFKICCGRNEAGYSGFVCRGVPTWTHGYRNYRISHSFVGCQYLERGADVEMGEAIALEARLQGANIGYGPVLDVARERVGHAWRKPLGKTQC